MAGKRSKNPIEEPPPAPSSSSSSSSDEENSSSEEEETQTPQTQKKSTLNIKPIATKPMQETSKAKSPRSKPLTSVVKASSSKRPIEAEQEPNEVKKPKKKTYNEGSGSATTVVVEEEKKSGEDTKKQLFQRLFTEDDEIAMLKGMLDYLEKKGIDPFSDRDAFHDFVKKSIHTDVSKAQLMFKIRRLRKRFINNAKKGKNGEDRTFSKPHEQKIYELSKKIWGQEGIAGKVESSVPKSNGKLKKKSKALNAPKAELVSSHEKKMDGETEKPMEVDKKGINNWVSLFDKRFGVGSLEEEILKHGMDMIVGEKRVPLEEKWRKMQIAELDLFLQKNDLVKEQVKLMLDFYKSEDA